jgi:hypothetical protein
MKQQTDPVFGETVDEDYGRLWQRIRSHRRTQPDGPD